jgi:penicillin amidase
MRDVVLQREGVIRIVRDAAGIPHVSAATERDLYYGMGYAQATDRGLQMLIMRILGQGRASELLMANDMMLELDVFLRQMSFAGDSDEVTKIEPDDRILLEAFCEGINTRFGESLPWEFSLIGYSHPAPWTLEDCIMMMRLIGYVGLAQGQGDIELFLVELAQAGANEQQIREFFGAANVGEIDIELLRKVKLNRHIIPSSLAWNPLVPKAIASNNWVISASRSASGKAMMCNDPHLEVNRLPAVWQEMVITLKNDDTDRYAMGAGMPGIPGIIVGRTNDVAWGATFSFLDGLDLWVENCKDGKYLREGEWLPFRERNETIKRKGKPDVEVTYFENDHGVLDGNPHEEGYYLAAKWACGEATGARSVGLGRRMFRAHTLEDAMENLGNVETAWNWVIATESGDIGYQMSGLYPKRREGLTGLVPQPGWDARNDWQGFAHHHDLPRAINPESGLFVTANNDLNEHGNLTPITAPMGDERARRIEQLLEAKEKLTPKDMQAIQHDIYSRQAEAYMKILDPLLPGSPQGRILHTWDRNYDTDSKGAFLFERFYFALIKEVFGKVLGADRIKYLLHETAIVIAAYACFDRVLLSEHSPWFNGESRDDIFRRVAANCLKIEPRRWGDVNRFMFTNIFFEGRLPAFLGFDRGPYELKGGRATPHQAQIFRAYTRQSSFSGSLRMVVDFANHGMDISLAGGPSDRRFSNGYASDIKNWFLAIYKRLEH